MRTRILIYMYSVRIVFGLPAVAREVAARELSIINAIYIKNLFASSVYPNMKYAMRENSIGGQI